MARKNEKISSTRRQFLIRVPVLTAGLVALMKTPGRAWVPTGNYRRRIDSQMCINCQACVDVCPTNAIEENNDTCVVNATLCIGCQVCDSECPVEAIEEGTEIIAPTVYTDECVACGACANECPTNAISVGEYAVITINACSGCRKCVDSCPVQALG